MNAGFESNHPSIQYYDSDYPSRDGVYPENFDAVTEYQGLAHDIERYLEIATGIDGPILELCCGTGRVATPLARNGRCVTGVDFSSAMLNEFRERLKNESQEVASRVTLFKQDITKLSLPGTNYAMAILAFNSLLCITDFQGQCAALERICHHLAPGGIVVIDAVNPLQLPVNGNPSPTPFFTRRNPHTGNLYTRFAMMGPMESDQKQQLHGWYDEMQSTGVIHRVPYSLYWRPIFRYELELMLNRAGFAIAKCEGGHQHEPFTAASPRMFVQALKSL